MNDLRFWKFVVVVNGAVPATLLAWDAARGKLGADAVSFSLHTTGIIALLFLILSLAVTPIRLLTGWNAVIGVRRSLGLFAFFYACAHLAIYVGFDQALDLVGAAHEIWSRRFLQLGTLALVLMIPLAVTSTSAMISRLGARRWKAVHRLAYVAAGLGVAHYFLLVKADVRQPIVFGGILGALMLARAGRHYADLRRAAAKVPAAAPLAPRRRGFWSGELVVARIFDETHDVKTFRLVSADDGPIPFEHAPGQYLNLRLDVDGRAINRSYTIASSPTRCGYCEITVKREPGGVASAFLHDRVAEGDRLKISAPSGRFVFRGETSDAVVLIAGGVGITPLMSIVRYLTDRGWPGEIHLLIANRTARDGIFADELSSLARRFPNLRVHVTLTRVGVEEIWEGRRGRIDREWLNQCVADLENRLCYVCGPDEMMASIRERLRAAGVRDAAILTEAFVSPALSRGPADAASSVDVDGSVNLPRVGGPTGHADVAATTAYFARSGKSVVLAPDTNVLEGAEAIGVPIPFECRAGICGQCKVSLLSGDVRMESEEALSASEKRKGYILACQARAVGDISVDA